MLLNRNILSEDKLKAVYKYFVVQGFLGII